MNNALYKFSSLDLFRAAEASERQAIQAQLLEQLGAEWQAQPLDDKNAIRLWHARLELPFRAIPGGQLLMGLSYEELEAVEAFGAGYEEDLAAHQAAASPTRQVIVPPFLCAEHPLGDDDYVRLMEGRDPEVTRAEAQAIAAKLGFDLPSEAQLEWLFRDGTGATFISDLLGTQALTLEEDEPQFTEEKVGSRFGLTDLLVRLWAADDWHPSYEGAPATAEPWLRGEDLANLYCAGTELVWGFASALRSRPGENAAVLLVRNL